MPPAFKTVLQLFRSFFPVRRMGDSASKILSPAEALPGRKESITVAGKDAGTRRRHGQRCARAPGRKPGAGLPRVVSLGAAQAQTGAGRGGAEGTLVFLCLASPVLRLY